MKGHYFSVSGDRAAARDVVYGVLKDQGFTLTEIDEWSAEANRGSSGSSIMLGAFAGKKGRRVKLDIVCESAPEGVAITLTQGTTGFSGGLIGKRQANDIYKGVYEAVSADFQKTGVLISERSLD